MIRTTLLSLVLGWSQPVPPRGHVQEPRPLYEARVTTQVDAAVSLTNRPEYLAALFIIDRQEGGLDPWVHAGLEHPNPHLHQDHGRARCSLQIHENRHIGHDGWLALAGTDYDATRRCFAEGLRIIRSSAWLCTHGQMISVEDMELVFAAYAGHGCSPTSSSKARARMWVGLVPRLRSGGKEVAKR